MSFEYQTISRHLNSVQVRICYSDVSAIQIPTVDISMFKTARPEFFPSSRKTEITISFSFEI